MPSRTNINRQLTCIVISLSSLLASCRSDGISGTGCGSSACGLGQICCLTNCSGDTSCAESCPNLVCNGSDGGPVNAGDGGALMTGTACGNSTCGPGLTCCTGCVGGKSCRQACPKLSCPAGDGGIASGACTQAGGFMCYCVRGQERQITCNEDAFDMTECLAFEPCLRGAVRPELFAPYGECVAARSCGQSMDRCTAEIGLPYINEPAVADFRSACLARHAQCRAAGAGFNDDYCADAQLANTPILAAWRSCLAGACADIRTCLRAVVTAAGCTN